MDPNKQSDASKANPDLFITSSLVVHFKRCAGAGALPLLFERANVGDHVLDLIRRHGLVGRHLRRLTIGDDRAQIRVAHLLDIGRSEIFGFQRFLTLAVWAMATGALGLVGCLGGGGVRLRQGAEQADTRQQSGARRDRSKRINGSHIALPPVISARKFVSSRRSKKPFLAMAESAGIGKSAVHDRGSDSPCLATT